MYPVRQSYGILSLDLSSKTGWCYGGGLTGKRVPEAPVFGVWKLPAPTTPGRQIVAFENELLDAIDHYQPRLVVYEAALPAHMQTHAGTAELLIGLAVMTDATCYRHEIEVRKEWPQTVRSKVMGPGNGRISSKDKEAGVIVRWLRERGYEVEDHNAADAILQWIYACQVRGTGTHE
jgi:hypothetical protein